MASPLLSTIAALAAFFTCVHGFHEGSGSGMGWMWDYSWTGSFEGSGSGSGSGEEIEMVQFALVVSLVVDDVETFSDDFETEVESALALGDGTVEVVAVEDLCDGCLCVEGVSAKEAFCGNDKTWLEHFGNLYECDEFEALYLTYYGMEVSCDDVVPMATVNGFGTVDECESYVEYYDYCVLETYRRNLAGHVDRQTLVTFDVIVDETYGSAEILVMAMVDQLADPESALLSGALGQYVDRTYGLVVLDAGDSDAVVDFFDFTESSTSTSTSSSSSASTSTSTSVSTSTSTSSSTSPTVVEGSDTGSVTSTATSTAVEVEEAGLSSAVLVVVILVVVVVLGMIILAALCYRRKNVKVVQVGGGMQSVVVTSNP